MVNATRLRPLVRLLNATEPPPAEPFPGGISLRRGRRRRSQAAPLRRRGNCHGPAARGGEELPERAVGNAEGNSGKPPLADNIGEGAAQMAGPDRLDMRELHARKSEARLGIGGAVWRQRVEMADQPTLRAAGRERPVDR